MVKILIGVLLLCCGCQSHIFASRILHRWAQQEFARHETLPFSVTRHIVLGRGVTHTFSLTALDHEHVSIDCGFGVTLKLKDPQYRDTWASLSLRDADMDGIDDLCFSAQFRDQQSPLDVIFLFQPTGWEQFLLPQFD